MGILIRLLGGFTTKKDLADQNQYISDSKSVFHKGLYVHVQLRDHWHVGGALILRLGFPFKQQSNIKNPLLTVQ